ncbi:MAG: hypothetical protein R3322_21365, partial [Kiloniellales bacterium]|nr:hypothetical protein [Kiloniellales bacterium]
SGVLAWDHDLLCSQPVLQRVRSRQPLTSASLWSCALGCISAVGSNLLIGGHLILLSYSNASRKPFLAILILCQVPLKARQIVPVLFSS